MELLKNQIIGDLSNSTVTRMNIEFSDIYI